MGIVMKAAKEKIGAAADGKTINEVVKAKLSQETNKYNKNSI